MAREFSRRLRVGAELQRVLNELLHEDVKDPRLKGVRVSEVDLSGDLGVARIFYSMLDPDADPGPVNVALQKAAAFMRSRVGREIKLRRVPELRFEQDLSIRQGMKISRLIDRSAEDHAHSDED